MKLKYTGLSHNRSFVKADFTRHGIDDQGAVHFNADNNWVAEVSDTAGEWLIANEAPDFRAAEESDETEADETRVNTQPRAFGGKKLVEAGDADDGDAGPSPGAVETPSGGRARAGRSSTASS